MPLAFRSSTRARARRSTCALRSRPTSRRRSGRSRVDSRGTRPLGGCPSDRRRIFGRRPFAAEGGYPKEPRLADEVFADSARMAAAVAAEAASPNPAPAVTPAAVAPAEYDRPQSEPEAVVSRVPAPDPRVPGPVIAGIVDRAVIRAVLGDDRGLLNDRHLSALDDLTGDTLGRRRGNRHGLVGRPGVGSGLGRQLRRISGRLRRSTDIPCPV